MSRIIQPTTPVAGCVAPNTPILLAGNRVLAAREIVPGMRLKSVGVSGEPATVSWVRVFQAESRVRLNGMIEVTQRHPFLGASGIWKRASDLCVGDEIAGEFCDCRIALIESVAAASTVIDIVTDLPFYAAGLATISKSAVGNFERRHPLFSSQASGLIDSVTR